MSTKCIYVVSSYDDNPETPAYAFGDLTEACDYADSSEEFLWVDTYELRGSANVAERRIW